jgi:hypothetical protein
MRRHPAIALGIGEPIDRSGVQYCTDSVVQSRVLYLGKPTRGGSQHDEAARISVGRDPPHPFNYAGWIMDITEGERSVGNIPFE